MHFEIYSENDGWEIQMFDSDGVIKGVWSWGHGDYESGAGGEKLFRDILIHLGHSVYEEEVRY